MKLDTSHRRSCQKLASLCCGIYIFGSGWNTQGIVALTLSGPYVTVHAFEATIGSERSRGERGLPHSFPLTPAPSRGVGQNTAPSPMGGGVLSRGNNDPPGFHRVFQGGLHVGQARRQRSPERGTGSSCLYLGHIEGRPHREHRTIDSDQG